MSFKNSTILVVGGAGFVGSNLCHRLLKEDLARLIIVDNLLSADISNVPEDSKVTFIQESITADRVLFNLPKEIDYIFHLSTYHGNQSSIHDPLADHENNTLTTLKLCERFKESSTLKKVVYSSAGCTVAKKTFDETEATDEDALVSLYLDSPYQISKIIGEFYGNYYLMRYKLPFVKARFQNVYGPREILGAGLWRGTPATIWRNVIPAFIWKALHNEALPVENGGNTSRDFIFVDDIVEGLIVCALKGESGGVYNLAAGVETSILELAENINRLTGNRTPIAMSPARAWDRSGRRYGDPSRSKEALNFKADIALNEGLTQTISWTKNNYETILNCISKHAYYVPEILKYKNNLKKAV